MNLKVKHLLLLPLPIFLILYHVDHVKRIRHIENSIQDYEILNYSILTLQMRLPDMRHIDNIPMQVKV